MTDQPTGGTKVAQAAGWIQPTSYSWTREVCREPLGVSTLDELNQRVRNSIDTAHLVIPDRDDFVRRCTLALLSGHLVLQGPPGTGKTTVARILADAFDASLRVSTATAEWSTYDLVGGLRPTREGSLVPVLGEVSEASLECSRLIREQSALPQAHWLLIDELNRADIDKAVGPLYTVLSSITGDHLAETPLNLWFETDDRQQVWIPSRFRFICTMNDVDTSFVNAISQGLTRRFQFLFLGVPTTDDDIENEVAGTFSQAHGWLEAQYGGSLAPGDHGEMRTVLDPAHKKLIEVVKRLRLPETVIGWPLGSAQIVDVWRSLLLSAPTVEAASGSEIVPLVDTVLADRVVPQMGGLDDEQLEVFEQQFSSDRDGLAACAAAIHHLRNTRATR